jgi:hypothetical protein
MTITLMPRRRGRQYACLHCPVLRALWNLDLRDPSGSITRKSSGSAPWL